MLQNCNLSGSPGVCVVMSPQRMNHNNCTILTSDAIVLRGSTGHSVGNERRHFHSVAVTGWMAKHLHYGQQLPAALQGFLLEM